jgi:hypothetical protein
MTSTLTSNAFVVDRERRMEIAKTFAQKGREGDVFFHRVSSNPLISAYLTTGPLVHGSSNLHEIRLTMVCEHPGYPLHINSFSDIIKKGYGMFCGKYDQSNATVEGVGRTSYTLTEYTKIIDDTINVYHGVQCFADGDLENKNDHNTYFMHICDIFNIMVHEAGGKQVGLLITTSSLPTITSTMKHIFFERIINSYQFFF